MSSSSSLEKENPFFEFSNCQEEYPRSSNMPCTGLKLFFCAMSFMFAYESCTKIILSLTCCVCNLLFFICSRSKSIPNTLPSGLFFFSINMECPDCPTVPSIKFSPGFGSRYSNTSFTRTGMCDISC